MSGVVRWRVGRTQSWSSCDDGRCAHLNHSDGWKPVAIDPCSASVCLGLCVGDAVHILVPIVMGASVGVALKALFAALDTLDSVAGAGFP